MHIFRMYWQRTLRMSGSIYLWMLIPFVFMAIYQMAFGGGGSIAKTTLAVVDNDSTFVSDFVAGAFTQGELSDLIQVRKVATLEEADDLFADGNASAALVIPAGFADSVLTLGDVTLTLYTNPRHFIGPQIAEGVTGSLVAMGNGLLGLFREPLSIIRRFSEEKKSLDADDVAALAKQFYEVGDAAPNLGAIGGIDVVTREPEKAEDDNRLGDDWNMATIFFPGLLVFGLLSASLGLETRFLHDRLNRVTQRMVMAPIAPWSLVLQQRLYAASFIFLVAVVSALIGGLLWRIEPVGLAVVAPIAVALTLFIVGINGAIFSLSNSLKATSAISSIVMIALVSVGGGFFPAEFIGSSFQSIARLTPTGLANIALTQALTGRTLTVSLPVLFVYCGAFFVVSVLLARRRVA